MRHVRDRPYLVPMPALSASEKTLVVYTDGSYAPHNHHGCFGHGGWAWWVNPDQHDQGAFLNAESSTQMEALAATHALKAFEAAPHRLVLVSDNTTVVRVLELATTKPLESFSSSWCALVALAQARGERLVVEHTRGHGHGCARHQQGNREADLLAGRARRAAARPVQI